MTARGRCALLIFFAFLLGPFSALAQTPTPTDRQILVKEIAVQGNRRVQEAVILGRVGAKIGSPFVANRTAEDIRAIFALGFFDDVQVKVEDFEGGVKLTFMVVERPFVRDIVFAGNKKEDSATLQEKIDLKLGSVYNPVEVNKGADKLKEYYETEGYFEVGITPEIEKLADGDVTVTYRIAEGRRISIDQIVIEGAQGLTPKQVKGAMDTQEREYVVLRGTVQRQRLDEDVDRIIQLYNDHGYVQARVESSEIQVDREKARATIRIVVVEGPQFKVGGVDVMGNAVLPVEEIRKRIELKTGEVFARSKLRDSVKGITDLYSAVGRASADVSPNTLQDTPGRLVNVVFEINEGPETYVERINISGNTRSEEKILRREIPMAEGDLFTSQKLARAKQKLTNLNYFDKVEAKTAPGSAKDKIIVNIDVTEKPTGLFSIGGGYSSQDGVLGTLDLSQRNFLGKGWEVFLRLRGGQNLQTGTIGFTEPWLFDQPLAAGFDIFNTRRILPDYTVNSLGGDIRLGHPLGEYSRWNAIYRVSQDRITNVNPLGSPELISQEGTHLTSLVGLSLSRDTRDSVYDPTRGTTVSLGVDFAGVGFGEKFARSVFSSTYFQPLPWLDHVLSFRLMAGYSFGWSKDPVPLFERFYLGGSNSLRQFKSLQVSPKDDTGTRIGGNSELLGTVEYVIPLFFGIKAAVFYDVGQVWGPDLSLGTKIDLSDLRHGVGAGLRWNSPFGPIRVDYGIKLDQKKGESFGNFNFSAGSSF
ncbi:MAG TPA: outer membrane protein assembly factor BamA [Methylomirabilota bacterium]|jgi:outer membrane protein insertion porin family|nr:outer membrane protein assembly factor BamA [Methylomirabilota bacterium]